MVFIFLLFHFSTTPLTAKCQNKTNENLRGLLLKTSSLEETISFLEDAVQKFPLNARLWTTLAGAHHQNGDQKKAPAAAQKAFNLAPTKENWRLLQAVSK